MAIDWSFWKYMPDVHLWQAAFLACNVDPDAQSYRDIENYGIDDNKVAKVLRLLKANLCERQFFTPGIKNLCDSNLHEVNLSEFAAWCLHIGIDIPPELSALAKVAPQPDFMVNDEVMTYNDALKEYVNKEPDVMDSNVIVELWARTDSKDDFEPALRNAYEKQIEKAVIDGELKAIVELNKSGYDDGWKELTDKNRVRKIEDGRLGRVIVRFTIQPNDFKAWLKKSNQWPLADGCLLAKWFEDELQAEVVGDAGTGSYTATEPNAKKLTKLKKQQAAILEVIKANNFNPMSIPDGKKTGVIQLDCENKHADLFNGSTSFDRAWDLGLKTLWQMENHESYARRGNN